MLECRAWQRHERMAVYSRSWFFKDILDKLNVQGNIIASFSRQAEDHVDVDLVSPAGKDIDGIPDILDRVATMGCFQDSRARGLGTHDERVIRDVRRNSIQDLVIHEFRPYLGGKGAKIDLFEAFDAL